MIPTHLEGKNAEQIVNDMIGRTCDMTDEEYYRHLEGFLVLAVKDALCNADEVKELIQDGEYKAPSRAIVFLNTILPKE